MDRSLKRERGRRTDARRRQSKPWRKLYNTKAWQQLRAEQLRREPLCQRCKEHGRFTPATVAHHVDRHHGDETKFFRGKLRSSCAPCHDAIEQSIEAKGYDDTIDPATGLPSDPNHPFNRKQKR